MHVLPSHSRLSLARLSEPVAKGGKNGEYEVGFGKPPKHSQFKKGCSGNPFGRPVKDIPTFKTKIDLLTDIVLSELSRPVEVKEGSQTLTLTTAEAIIRSLNIGAIKGNRVQQKTALELGQIAQAQRRQELFEEIQIVTAYKELWEPRFEAALAGGRPEPKQLPHPAHVNIDRVTCELQITGPDTPEFKERWELTKCTMRQISSMIVRAKADLVQRPNNKRARELLTMSQKLLRKHEKNIPPGWNWREQLGWESTWDDQFGQRKV